MTYDAINLSLELLLFLHPKCFSFMAEVVSWRNFVPSLQIYENMLCSFAFY